MNCGNPKAVGKPYRPAHDAEGNTFVNQFCGRCKHGAVRDCEIYEVAFWSDIGSWEYPPELIYDTDSLPTCTAFELGETYLERVLGKWEEGKA